jgi:hypothetical protein
MLRLGGGCELVIFDVYSTRHRRAQIAIILAHLPQCCVESRGCGEGSISRTDQPSSALVCFVTLLHRKPKRRYLAVLW